MMLGICVIVFVIVLFFDMMCGLEGPRPKEGGAVMMSTLLIGPSHHYSHIHKYHTHRRMSYTYRI